MRQLFFLADSRKVDLQCRVQTQHRQVLPAGQFGERQWHHEEHQPGRDSVHALPLMVENAVDFAPVGETLLLRAGSDRR